MGRGDDEPQEKAPVVEGEHEPKAVPLEVARRLRQQELIASFGLYALSGRSLQDMLDKAVRLAAEGMAAPFAKVLEFLPLENSLLFRAGVGWPDRLIGTARIEADLGSPAGFAYHTCHPVISNELRDDDRFRTPELLAELGIRRAINVVVRGEGLAYGILEVDSPDGEAFSEFDVHYLQALANTLGVAIDKEAAAREIERLGLQAQLRAHAAEASEARYRRLTETLPSLVWTGSDQGSIHYLSEHWVSFTGEPIEAGLGQGWGGFVHPDEREVMFAAWGVATASDQSFEYEHRLRARDGFRWCLTRAVPFRGAASGERQWVGTTTDIDAQKRTEAALAEAVREREELLAQKELLIREVDHRVKNSLMLSRSLLSMQARLAEPGPAQEQLTAAANRLLTVARVHDRLYRHETLGVVEIGRYLQDLCTDLATALGVEEAGRSLHVAVEGGVMGAAQAVPLGLIVTELLTNAVKHGHGAIRLELSTQTEGARLLKVTDEGRGMQDAAVSLPHGLGMNLVTMLARQLGGEFKRGGDGSAQVALRC